MTHRYSFAVHEDDNRSDNLGGMELPNDREAFDFGRLVIRDLMHFGAPKYAGWSLDITKDKRLVRSLPFKPVAVSKKKRQRKGLGPVSRRRVSFS